MVVIRGFHTPKRVPGLLLPLAFGNLHVPVAPPEILPDDVPHIHLKYSLQSPRFYYYMRSLRTALIVLSLLSKRSIRDSGS